jgi:hypothetical protein
MGTMNKKITMALVALMLTAPITATAAPKSNLKNTSLPTPTIAILDSAIDMSQQKFKDRVVYEVCLIESFYGSTPKCPNGLNSMEGPGAATLPIDRLALGGFDHGTLMADQAIQTNPNVNIVFIRIIGQRANGSREFTNEATVYNALQWVVNNQSKFNIQSVAMAQGSHSVGPVGTDYCPKTPTTVEKINSLNSLGVAVFFPAGNNSDYKRVNWPGCIPSAITMGATLPSNAIAFYSNYDPVALDFYARGTTSLQGLNGKKSNFAGTSASVMVGATSWATVKSFKPSLSYSDVYSLILKTSTKTNSSKVLNGNLINLQAALNG